MGNKDLLAGLKRANQSWGDLYYSLNPEQNAQSDH